MEKPLFRALFDRMPTAIRRKINHAAANAQPPDSDIVTVRLKKSDVPWHGILTAHASIAGTRQSQQDALYVDDAAVFADGQTAAVLGVLCDGMGGMEDGERASAMAVDGLRAEYRRAVAGPEGQAGMDGGARAFFDMAIRKLNREIFNMGGGIGDAASDAADSAGDAHESSMAAPTGPIGSISAARAAGPAGRAGTTLVAAIIVNDRAYWASVGDSRIYVYRRGRIVQLTRDHSYAFLLSEMAKNVNAAGADVGAGASSNASANANAGTGAGADANTNVNANANVNAGADIDLARNALVSFIGMKDISILDICESPFKLENGDIVLLCSDGLVKALSDEAIAETMSRHQGNLNEMARRLPMAAQEASARSLDNTSVVLLQYME